MSDEYPRTVIAWYAGRRATNDDKMGDKFYVADTDEELFFARGKSAAPRRMIGVAYAIEQIDTDRYKVAAAEPAEGWERAGDGRVDEWRLLDQAAVNTVEGARAKARLIREAKEANANLEDLTLGQVREMMRGKLPDQRAGIITAVFRYLGPNF